VTAVLELAAGREGVGVGRIEPGHERYAGKGQVLEHSPAVPVRKADELVALAPQQVEHGQAYGLGVAAPSQRRRHAVERQAEPSPTTSSASTTTS